MFTIEFIALHPDVRVIDRTECKSRRIADADYMADSLLYRVRLRHPAAPPEGYRILDKAGAVVLRSWET